MLLLLDTHSFLWWLSAPEHLSEAALAAIRNPKSRVYLSAATMWEIAIKKALGKLEVTEDLEKHAAANQFLPLPITFAHAKGVEGLPPLHRDPFDRMLVSQARCEQLTLVTRDPNIQKYPVPVLAA